MTASAALHLARHLREVGYIALDQRGAEVAQRLGFPGWRTRATTSSPRSRSLRHDVPPDEPRSTGYEDLHSCSSLSSTGASNRTMELVMRNALVPAALTALVLALAPHAGARRL